MIEDVFEVRKNDFNN